jgi:RIO-like serine/threonine protein kinase
MDNIARLYKDYSALPEKKAGISFSGFEILRVCAYSVVVADATRAVKFIVADQNWITPVKEEYETLERFKDLEGELFVTPKPLDWGPKPLDGEPYLEKEKIPDYIVMTRLGERPQNEEDCYRASVAMGEFAGKIWKMGGFVYADFHAGNVTLEPDGKIGIIDVASFIKTDFPEAMFWCPMLQKEISCPAIAAKFTEETGIQIDFGRIDKMVEEKLPIFLKTCPSPEIEKNYRENVESNLRELKKALVCERPSSPVKHEKLQLKS